MGGFNYLTALFPSYFNPKSVKDAAFVYCSLFEEDNYLAKDGEWIDTNHLIGFDCHSTIRVYKNIFLTYDKNTESWVLVRIIVS